MFVVPLLIKWFIKQGKESMEKAGTKNGRIEHKHQSETQVKEAMTDHSKMNHSKMQHGHNPSMGRLWMARSYCSILLIMVK